MSKTIHKSVLLEESIEGLNLKKGDTVVDATLGGGGHSLVILSKILPGGKLIAIDADSEAIERFKAQSAKRKTQNAENIFLVNDNFANLENILESLEIKKVDAILADLGFSSDQMEDTERGFSFRKDAELDMRFSLRITCPPIAALKALAGGRITYEYTNKNLTAKDVVNNYSEEDLVRILKDYGEERFAKSIARKICDIRTVKEIKTTGDLVEIIKSATPGKYHHQKLHFATRTFQALRIEVNQELESLEKFIPQALEVLKPRGRLAVISFHSLEDRIVKNIFRENARGCICPPALPVCRCGHEPVVKAITKKPIVPSEGEINVNPRSRSAKLRIAEKMA